MKDFLWDGRKKGLITMEAASAPRESGGLGIPSIEARLKAIQIMWLKKYLETKEKRPTWVWLADNLIIKDIAPNTRIFTNQKITEEIAKQKPVLREHDGSGKNWIIYTDGSLFWNPSRPWC